METLILGNGISRLSFIDIIKNWKGEIWGCNRAYLEFGKILTYLIGHGDAMEEAKIYRIENQCKFKIMGGPGSEKELTGPPQFWKDSGSTLVSEALHLGRKIAVCGFDLGGLDVHSPGIEKVNKHNWVDRWRDMIKLYGTDNIRFIGFGHLPFLESRENINKYANQYLADRPHILTPEYLKAWEFWTGKKPELGYMGDYMVEVKYLKGQVSGQTGMMKGAIAEKMEKRGLVEILKSEAPAVEMSDDIKAMIKDIKGLGIKSAVKLFQEKEAFDDDLQLAALEEFQAE